jgi:hypothetical protein
MVDKKFQGNATVCEKITKDGQVDGASGPIRHVSDMVDRESRRAFWLMVHRALIIFDDWICDTFNASRKGRGRYEA